MLHSPAISYFPQKSMNTLYHRHRSALFASQAAEALSDMPCHTAYRLSRLGYITSFLDTTFCYAFRRRSASAYFGILS